MNVRLLCDQEPVSVTLPDSVTLLDMQPVPALPDAPAAVKDALENPIDSKPLSEIAKGRKNACIVISDITRPVPNEIILVPMLETLEAAGIARENIVILIATGMHRPNLGDELRSMVGSYVMDNYRIENHYCQKAEEYRKVDEIDGAPIEINTHYLDADLKILTGLIEPHFYAGFSGSRKSILPGISSYETMKFMHSFRVIDQLREANLKLDGNIFHEYAVKVTEMVGADFIVNVVINEKRETAGVFAGHYDTAHRKGCEMVKHHTMIEIPDYVDLVITSAGGYPLDTSFYQVAKALTCAHDILKPGGKILVTCGCREGLGNEEFCEIMRTKPTPEDFCAYHCEPDNFVIDQWCAQNIYQALDKAGKVYVYSPGLSKEDIEGFGAVKVDDVQATVDELLAKADSAVVVPPGPYVVGKVAK